MFSKKLAVYSDHNKFWGFVCITPCKCKLSAWAKELRIWQVHMAAILEHICNTSIFLIFTVHIFLGQAAVVFGSHAETKSVVSVAVRLEVRGRCSWCMFGFTRFVGHLNLRFWTGNLTFFVWSLVFCRVSEVATWFSNLFKSCVLNLGKQWLIRNDCMYQVATANDQRRDAEADRVETRAVNVDCQCFLQRDMSNIQNMRCNYQFAPKFRICKDQRAQ